MQNKFYLALSEGDVTVEAELTADQVTDMLLDGVDPLLDKVVFEVLGRNEVLAKKVQHFLNKEGEEVA